MHVIAINGAYRADGATDQLLAVATRTLLQGGATVDSIILRDRPIDFCLNCRACMQRPGEAPGPCVLRDDMQEIVDRIEACDALVLAAPTNAGSATAVFKRFMERLAVYGYWPWGKNAPSFRKARAQKKPAILISTCGAPGFLGKWFFSTNSQLAKCAGTLGAKVCGSLSSGLHASKPTVSLSASQTAAAERLARKLLRARPRA